STIARKPCPFARDETDSTFNRVAIESASDGSRYTINRHPMWFDNAETKASPFLGFRYYGNHRSMIRNFEVTGQPVIPREVILSSGTQQRGWQSRYFGESKRSAHPNPNAATSYHWSLEDKEILARKDETEAARQSLLRYQRPLLEDETLR